MPSAQPHKVAVLALDGLYAEFIERSRSAVAVPKGGLRYLRKLAGSALGETAAQEIKFFFSDIEIVG